ncbi:MAG: M15 family metallopeptidase [Glaciecola sp.]
MISAQQILGLNDEHVIVIDDKHQLQPLVIGAFTQMQQAAKLEGHDLQLVSSYRSFSKQESIWNRKWKGELKLNTLDDKVLDPASLGDIEKMHAILLWSALPGGSRHHWGTDFDVFDRTKVEAREASFELVSREYKDDGPCAELAKWLQNNAASFGFERPYAEYVGGVAAEPWHLSYSPIANQIITSFSVEILRKQLIESNILGLDTVLSDLHILFERYTLNRGIK